MENLINDYGIFILVLAGAVIFMRFGIRKQKWCPNCRKASCVPVGKPVNDRQHMSCPKCGFNKQINLESTHAADGGDGAE